MMNKIISKKSPMNNALKIVALSLSSFFIASAVFADQNKGTILSPPSPDNADHKFRMNVAIANDSYSDPIKFLNQSTNAHHHLFIGNGNIDNDTTNAPGSTGSNSLRFDTKPIDFMEGNGANRSAYWVPVMYNHGPDGQIGSESAQADDFPMVMGFNQVYYVKGNNLSDAVWEASIKAMPEGLKIIASTREYVFNCGFRDEPDSTHFIPLNGSTDNQWPDGFWPPNKGASIPKCNTSISNNVSMKITFPDCWDGVNLTDKDDDTDPLTTSPDTNHDHMVYSGYTTGCPSSHPVQLGTVQYNLYFPIKSINDDTSKYYLSSDVNMMNGYSMMCEDGKNGCTNHGDWMNGWEPTLMDKMVNTTDGCLGSKIDHCANGKLDHDETLENSISGNTASDFQSLSFNYTFKHNKPIIKEHTMDTEAPSKPGKPMVSDITQNSVKLNWIESVDNIGVVAYEVHYNGVIKNVSGTTATLTDLTPNVSYSIKIRAKDAVNNKSVFSDSELAVTNAISSFTLNYTAESGGHIEGASNQTVNKDSSGSTVTAIADDGYSFKKWSDGLTTASRTDANISEDMTLVASFTDDSVSSNTTFTLTYLAGVGGKIEGVHSQVVKKDLFGSLVRAVADEGYVFNQWSDGVTTAVRVENHVTENKTYTASFITADKADFDKDGIPDITDTDDDNDGFSDEEEIEAGTNPLDSSNKPENSDSNSDSNSKNDSDSGSKDDSTKESGGSPHPAGLLVLLALIHRKLRFTSSPIRLSKQN